MKFLRLLVPLFALSAALAACGGGGGGGSTPPVTTPSGNPQPSSNPSTKPSSAPSTTPSQSPSPSASSVPVDKSFALSAQEGPQVNGLQSWYTAGITATWPPPPPGNPPVDEFGDTSAGANSTNGFAAMDGMSCTPTVEPAQSPSTYAVHSFVGIYDNGQEYAIPSAIGMNSPIEPTAPTKNAPNGHPNDNYEVEQWACEYNVHTHDFSGLIHIEDVNYPQSTQTTSPLPYKPTLQSLLDIWGVQLTANGMTVPGGNSLAGNVAIYVGTPGSDIGPHGGALVDSYTQVASPSDVSLAFHDTAWIVIGGIPTLPDGTTALPSVEWRVEY